MKKISLLLVALALVAFTACSGNKSKEESNDKKEKTEKTEAKGGHHDADGDLPKFDDDAVNDYVKVYYEFVTEYVTIYKDMMAGNTDAAAKMQDLSQKGTELATKAGELQGSLKASEVEKFKQFTQKMAKKITDATQQ